MKCKTKSGIALLASAFIMLAAVIAGGWGGSLAHAQNVRVLAVVNNQPITNLDIMERLSFLTGTTGISVTDENRERINQDVLQMLIDDVIKREVGRRLGGGIENAARARATKLVNASFSQHGEDPDQVLARLGISRKTAESKYLTDVLWVSAVQARFSEQFANIRTEAEQELRRVRENFRKPHISLDEIVLAPGPNRSFAETMELADQIVDSIRNQGADFAHIAQQYSSTGSAGNGGSLGWIQLEHLPDDVRAHIEKLPAESIAEPIEVDGAIAIYRIRGIRRDGKASPLEDTVTVARLVHPVISIGEDIRAAEAVSLKAEIRNIKNCNGLEPIHRRGGSNTPLIMGTYKLAQIAPQLRGLLMPLAKGEKTEPINFAEGLIVFMVCDRISPEVQVPTIANVEERLRNSYFTVIASRYLQRLRRNAVISVRDDA